jgi:hypothetical protein
MTLLLSRASRWARNDIRFHGEIVNRKKLARFVCQESLTLTEQQISVSARVLLFLFLFRDSRLAVW